jgi:hypothetical protein
MRQLIVATKFGHTISGDPVVNNKVKPMLPTGLQPKEEEDCQDEHDRIIVLQEAADKKGILLPTIYNGHVAGKKTDPNKKGIRPLLPNTKY